MTVGTLPWARRTGGRLNRREALAFRVRAVRAQVLRRRGVAVAGHVELAAGPPESAFARHVLDTARILYSDPMLGHCLRSWLWADLFAQAGRVAHDPELLYAACLLHDLGLTDGYAFSYGSCFAVEGAVRAHGIATTNGYPRADALAEAVSLHLNITVPVRLGAEAHLLHAGTAMDVVGRRAGALPERAVRGVLARHPRDGFVADLMARAQDQVAVRPHCRIALLWRLGFPDLIRRADRRFTAPAGPDRSG